MTISSDHSLSGTKQDQPQTGYITEDNEQMLDLLTVRHSTKAFKTKTIILT